MNYGPLRDRFGWPTAATSAWRFLSRKEQAAATVLSMEGVDRLCLRSPKMARVETALLVADGPLSSRKLVQVATLADVAEVHRIVEQLNTAYSRAACPFQIERVATGYQLLTRPEFAHWLGKLHQRQADLKLTPPALETLTILAYRQPMTRADLEAIRGVQCTDLLKMLMDRGLVRIAGEEDTLGRPYLYETTRKFLELFGLRSLEDLPEAGSLRKRSSPVNSSEPAPEAEAA